MRCGPPATLTADVNTQAVTHFQFTDWLGTRRVQTDALGSPEEICTGGAFGDATNCLGEAATDRHFTGKERDQETASVPGRNDGLDYFGARYYSSNLGRWISPDWDDKPEAVPYSSLTSPQTLNLYGYLRGNPLAGIDPNGHSFNTDEAEQRYLGFITGIQRGVKTAPPTSQQAQPHNTTTPVQAGAQWLTGTGPRDQTFHDGDPFTEQLRHHDNVQNVINGVRDGSLPPNGDHDYNLGGVTGVGLYLRDYSTLLTGGATGNLAVTYLGSYSLHYTTSEGVITMTVRNTSSWVQLLIFQFSDTQLRAKVFPNS